MNANTQKETFATALLVMMGSHGLRTYEMRVGLFPILPIHDSIRKEEVSSHMIIRRSTQI
jgi:hypothetical protein